ncbi:LADA_0A04170g1_1 [Lachancea dasiensis]|uniref:LADA_0A04170g1_1 n=1 Tax=Lachancea dasiensis TaxID=1072105 RepID=A0A1G4INC8_9SACH|nr:LADA_0A04170g1_1 [Lachancea dasiensis]
MSLRKAATRSVRAMSRIVSIQTKSAPAPAAPYSQAIKANKMVFVSGQIPYTADFKPIEGSMGDKAEQVIKNVSNILQEANSGLHNVVKVNVFMSDLKYFEEFNTVYARYFAELKPARSCLAAKALPLNVDVEMEVIALENE